ncbi:sushi, von Willebrand factor type A, EGF and pentraxin domain-containing protein 1-like [Patiria miniata]|uniref:Sushi, von Willebrand factor type A, EGF and pentraxin domain-containing protein 1-like n=1 Tax=Patiria miniata TaxID=46514 RepID=A0A913ZU72_PATMI|nr:sushi, von Willebrand factor type A, EGF and pentraxin domain-containing protein 1-like [Patiria miniata]
MGRLFPWSSCKVESITINYIKTPLVSVICVSLFSVQTMTTQVAVILACLLLAPHASMQQQAGILDSAFRRVFPHGKSELVFLLDSSDSIGADDFGVELFFVESLMTEFSIGWNATQVAIVSYSENVTRHIDYISGESGNKCTFLSAMKAVNYTGGSSTDTAKALQEAREILVHSRPDVKRVVILLSDGVSNTGDDPVTVANLLKAGGVEIFTISVKTQLERIASTGDHYFAYHSFDDFERLALRARRDPHETMYDDSVNQTLCDSLCHQPFPEAGYGCCDLTAKCTCSLDSGRHACVCGPGTYGRNGFLLQCKLCPRGTYKSTYEPTDGCTPCPPDSTTAAEGSKLLGACFCKEGYEGDPMRGESCRYDVPPEITCPFSVVTEADPGLSSAEVSWDMPIIQDNQDGTDALTLTVSPSGMKPPYRFEIGWVVITYTVTDSAGLSSVCPFKVVVLDTQPPTVESCPGPIIDITSGEKIKAVTWDEPQFGDNSMQDLQIVKSHEQGANLSWGTHIVTYTATDSARLSAECRFTIRLGLVTCPILTSPRNGQMSPSPCSNHSQSVCSFHCDVGYELEDAASAERRCQANGHWTETIQQCRKSFKSKFKWNYCSALILIILRPLLTMVLFTLTEVQCVALSKPSNGLISCQNQEAGNLNVYGTICRFTCSNGYNPAGSRERVCTASGEWSGDDFTCRSITCPILPPLRHGSIEPSQCANKRRVKFICIFKCKEGFRRVGPTFKMCEASGSWSNPGEEVACVDDVPPEITCPASVVKEADPGLSSAEVSWDMPIIQDNQDGTDALTLTVSPSGMKPPHRFEIGSVVITYTVTDSAGLSSVCPFKVVVLDTQPPTVDSCPVPIIDITSADKVKAVTWDEPQFADNSRHDLQIVKSHEQGANLSWGTHIVTYTATDSARLSAECRFTIRLGPSSCPNYPDPRNGARACDQWLFGQFCRVHCNRAFEFTETPAIWYICSGSTWRTFPTGRAIPWPDCSERAPAHGSRRGMSSQYMYYVRDCINSATQGAIKAAFVEDFKDSILGKNGGCFAENSCEVEYVTVYCGEIDENTRRRRPRAADPGDETDFANVVTLDFTVTTRIRSVDKTQLENQLANAVRTLDEISRDYERLAQAGQLQLVVDNQILPVVEDSVLVNQSVPLCQNGSVALDGTDCISCAVGSYLDSNRQACRVCDEGTYQDEDGQDQCKSCPWGTWTEGPQAKDVSECRPECKPGTYSPSGLATCWPCTRGFFQPGFKQTACLPCREGTTTPAKGSRSASDCQAVCGPGTFSATGLQPCRPCPLGSYQPDEQQTHCVPCAGSETTAVDGATSEAECREIDACESAPCENGAQCTSHRGAFHCQCVTGFAGTTCDTEIDECRSQPCLFNATCVDQVGGFDCLCTPGYEGALCGTEINECLSDPCQNEAKCQDQVAGFDCDCVDGFWGPLCENRPDPCAGQACLNEGFCIPTPGSFQCLCQSGFKGLRCETDVNECDLLPCQNGARCENTPGGYQCACVPGFEGTHCEVNIDECVHHSCANGSTCSDVIAGYQCLCPPGVTGQFCETEMSQDFLLNFTSSLTSDFSLIRTRHAEFQEITLSVWLRTTDTTNMGTPISYAATRPASNSSAGGGGAGTGSRLVDNALTVTDCSSLRVYVNGLVIFTEVAVNNGRWHSLAFTWRRAVGDWHLYVNGTQAANGTTGPSTEAIPGQGAFVLGQEQDAIGGAFSSREAYLGEIYKLNIWDRVLPEDDIQNLSHFCHQEKGNVVAWSDFLAGLEGGLEPKPTNATGEVPGCEFY